MQNIMFRSALAVALAAGALGTPAPSAADPQQCDYPACTPGIMPDVVLGAPCSNTTYYVFGSAVAGPSTLPGRLVFCGSPRRYDPRWFRSPEMHGIKEEGSKCDAYDGEVAQAPDGLFLTCVADAAGDGQTLWRRGDL
ncbi:hypothetical protein H7K14_05455 [Mycolicibacter longobardus]|uniref:Ig-like domain-containing protein n=2 Tax=Mycolicibacter longobardus TaxID=1108812 RepID=A0A1X1YSH7_9MYCO|nr:hypothetical protein [Mycolicibacter longobardus]MCV7383273.1 hypothetical protein [Mycolicibacter longobardus]ORW13993.1 hypothetical protein AWC16_03965 [Mycolicibacter longobardus]